MDRAALVDRIADVLAGAQKHPLGVAGLMIVDEIKAGRAVVQPGCEWPFVIPAEDWTYPVVISHDGREVRIIAIHAAAPGNGAFRRLIDNIAAAGLSPVVVEPVGVVMPAIMKRWGWRGRVVGKGFNRFWEWRPSKALGRGDGAERVHVRETRADQKDPS
jgi:hypothetical protein